MGGNLSKKTKPLSLSHWDCAELSGWSRDIVICDCLRIVVMLYKNIRMFWGICQGVTNCVSNTNNPTTTPISRKTEKHRYIACFMVWFI